MHAIDQLRLPGRTHREAQLSTKPSLSDLNCASHCAKICADTLFWSTIVATNLDIDNALIEEAMSLG